MQQSTKSTVILAVKTRQRKNSSSSLPLSIPKIKDFEQDKTFRFLIEFGAGAMGGALSRTL